MLAEADLAAVADLMAGHRASLLLALMGGRDRSASDLVVQAATVACLTSDDAGYVTGSATVGDSQESPEPDAGSARRLSLHGGSARSA